MKFVRILVSIYATLCLISLILIPASARGWFSLKPEPLAAIYAILLGAPWSLLLSALGDPGPVAAALLIASGMGLNIFIVLKLASRFLR